VECVTVRQGECADGAREYRTITGDDGRSRTVVQGYPTTTNLFEFQSDSGHPPQTKAKQTKTNQSLASVDDHDVLTDLAELKAMYAFTFGIRPGGPKCNVASWLRGKIQAAQYQVMDEHAHTSNQPEQTSTDKRTEQIMNDSRLADTLAINDQNFSARFTRAAKQENDLVSHQDGITLQDIYDHQEGNLHGGVLGLNKKVLDEQLRNSIRRQTRLQTKQQDSGVDGSEMEEIVTTREPVLKRRRIAKQAAHSTKRQRVSTGTLVMSKSANATPDATIRKLKDANAGSEHPIGDALSDNAGHRMG
jgi:hypothetical protein